MNQEKDASQDAEAARAGADPTAGQSEAEQVDRHAQGGPAAVGEETQAEDPAGASGQPDPVVADALVAEVETMDPAELHLLLEDARAEATANRDQLLRAHAEMENMKRRQAKELENAHKFALEGFVKELLAVRDSLELGYSAATQGDGDLAKLIEGTDLTLKQLGDAMSKFGVERVHPEGEPFNPEFHQAMSMQPREDLPPNTVTAVMQSGYLLNGRLVRPAMVMVSKQG